MGNDIVLPERIYLDEYGGNYQRYIDAIYDVFKRDFIKSKPKFGSHFLNLKFNPLFQERAYTFYHMTHKGEIEQERIPDLRRCECLSWAKPCIENVENWNLKFWRQSRIRSNNRVCIWLESEIINDNYFIVLEVRETYVLLWTAFVATYSNEIRKKQKEYEVWKQNEGKNISTPDDLISKIQGEIKKQGAENNSAPVSPLTPGQ